MQNRASFKYKFERSFFMIITDKAIKKMFDRYAMEKIFEINTIKSLTFVARYNIM